MLLAACFSSVATSTSAAVRSPFADAYLNGATSAPFLADINLDDPYRSGYRYLRVGGNGNYNHVSLPRFDLVAQRIINIGQTSYKKPKLSDERA